ncbi:MAG: hypothetical protein JWM37_725 [Candidatus Saccharibacteria bacterium]|nr:hypothetical protein [Candidatus Saccharibacteria bacterium]
MEPKPFNQQPSIDGVVSTGPIPPVAPTPTLASPQAPAQPVTPSTEQAFQPSQPASFAAPGSTVGPTIGGGDMPPAAPNPGQPAVFGGGPQPPITNLPMGTPDNGKSKKKKLIIIGIIALLIVLAAAATYVFAFYIPNKPENVWKTGLDRTGTTLSKLVDSASEDDKLKSYEKSEVTGSIDIKSDDGSGSASFAAKFDPKNVDSGMDFNFTQSGETLNASAKLKAALASGNEYPDLYFQITGLKDFGLDGYVPGISNYDGKWITVSSDTIKSLADQSGATSADNDKPETPTAADIAELTKAVTKVGNDYVFTSDESKAVLTRQSFVAKETTSQGVKAYHYKATLNKDHLKLACEALINSVYETKAFQKLASSDEKTDSAKKDSISSCKDSVESGVTSDQKPFDVWIDAKYKLLHKVRIDDDDDAGTYVELGQSFKGGDVLPFFVTYHGASDKTDVTWSHELNTKTYKSSGTINATSKDSSNVSLKSTYTIAPYSGTIDSAAPSGTVPIETVMKQLGFDPNAM